jgi:hypothetical protein
MVASTLPPLKINDSGIDMALFFERVSRVETPFLMARLPSTIYIARA